MTQGVIWCGMANGLVTTTNAVSFGMNWYKLHLDLYHN